MGDTGIDKVCNDFHSLEVEETFEDALDGQCLGRTRNGKSESDEGDAQGTDGKTSGEKAARMPVHKNSPYYNMDHPKRGMALIFNHEFFDDEDLLTRRGTNEDCRNLKECLIALGFDVQVFKDLDNRDIEQHIDDTAKIDHNKYDCLLISVLSHGDLGIVHAKDGPYKPETLWTPFTADKCPSLAGKPKIFFLQACRGRQFDSGIILKKTETDGEQTSYKIPVEADFLIVYSTAIGYFSWRNPVKGSWFIQSLCDELKKKAFELDLLSILTFVSKRVALDCESNVPDIPSMHQQKQVPCIVSMLTRFIQFNHKEGDKEV
ncbi:caspase-1-like isoform X1 [Diabrotica virgifera virgifera]|uniref:Caspase-1-like n=1 Tax=Diabrotica virgifera virgifera TaxID=50390 RepID=A0ABM5L5Q2_DIAVI|nr:caspase-1-like isoform X1 [Diabrotica virgifera virgifera]